MSGDRFFSTAALIRNLFLAMEVVLLLFVGAKHCFDIGLQLLQLKFYNGNKNIFGNYRKHFCQHSLYLLIMTKALIIRKSKTLCLNNLCLKKIMSENLLHSEIQ